MAKKLTYTEQINGLLKISSAITSDLWLEDILKLIVTVAANVMNSKICSLLLIDENTRNLAIRATQSMSEDYIKKPPLKIGESIAGKVVKENKVITVADVRKDKRYKYKDIAKKEGLCSLLCVPLCVKGKVIGAINCYTSFPHKFTKTEIDIFMTVANQAAIAIENTKLLVRSKIIQEELETRKLVERAKGILMSKYSLSEASAYRRIQKLSMDSRKSMHEVADAIILASKIKSK
ncbi:MAG: GAF and ANTAR domain-containing protein [bacterium]|nr:GAF and ANTAR domain-containing protein [bacterium]